MTSVSQPTSVAIVNDSPVVALGVAALLRPFRQRVRVEAYVGCLPARGRVDVVLYDPFGRPDALDRLREIARETGAEVLVYAWAVTQRQIDDAIEAGAAGYLSKTVDGEEMVAALEAVAAGQILEAVPAPDGSAMAAWPGRSEGLTARESEIVSLIVAGMSNQDIASATYLSINSVKTYIRTAYRRMGVASRTQAVVWGIHHGFQTAASTAHPSVQKSAAVTARNFGSRAQ